MLPEYEQTEENRYPTDRVKPLPYVGGNLALGTWLVCLYLTLPSPKTSHRHWSDGYVSDFAVDSPQKTNS